MRTQARKPTTEQFWAKVDLGPADKCWPWRGSLHVNGYGHWQSARSAFVAHRLAYELLVGPLPPRTHLFHTCALRSCVNPRHLRPVQHQEQRAIRERPITTIEIAWAAGIWEGEGSCWPNARTKIRPGRSMTVHIEEWLAECA